MVFVIVDMVYRKLLHSPQLENIKRQADACSAMNYVSLIY